MGIMSFWTFCKILAKEILQERLCIWKYLKTFFKKHMFARCRLGHFLQYKLNFLNNTMTIWCFNSIVEFDLLRQESFDLMFSTIQKNLINLYNFIYLIMKNNKRQLFQKVWTIFQFPYNSDFIWAKVPQWVLIPAVISTETKPHFVNKGQLVQTGYANRK